MVPKLEVLRRIHNLLSALGRPRAIIDFTSIEILLMISDAEKSGKPLKVSDVRFDSRFGSQATALKRLRKLIEIDWIIAADDPEDSRTQRLSLSVTARNELNRVAEKIAQSFNAE